ncbi:MAG: sigma-70 family RNA polymerase sigma factor [Ignavibacteria bacterium]|nr:sigma-70 family RNA polymerase sigma factor [Ignavibacteria bacterium]
MEFVYDINAMTPSTDAEILAEYRTGRRDVALTAFVRMHQRFVMSVALRHSSTAHDAEDAAQEVFLRVATKLGEFQGNSTLQTWLYRITVNVCTSIHRRRKFTAFFGFGEAEGELDVPSSASAPSQLAEHNEFDVYIKNVLAELPPKQRETFCMRHYDELSYEEIAEITGTSEGALKANYHWAVKKIAEKVRSSEYYANWKEGTR